MEYNNMKIRGVGNIRVGRIIGVIIALYLISTAEGALLCIGWAGLLYMFKD